MHHSATLSPIDRLIDALARLPGIGPRTARRLVLQMVRNREVLMPPLIGALESAYRDITECNMCGNLDTQSPCNLCTDPKRDDGLLCIVEDIADVWALERSALFKGRYHVLGGTLSAIDGRGPDALSIEALMARVSSNPPQEIILALNATVEGQTTAHYISERLAPFHVKTTRLAHGIPMGGELDYLDEGTLGAALKARVSG